MQLRATKESTFKHGSPMTRVFWPLVTKFWAKWPEYWEDLLVQGLKLGLEGGPQAIPHAFNTLAGRVNITKERT
jgi:hypothetical protein